MLFNRRVSRSSFFFIRIASTVFFGTVLAASALAATNAAPDPNVEHDRCVELARNDPQAGLDRAKQWSKQGGGFAADHCAAMALFDLKRYRDAADAFDKLAKAMVTEAPADRARVYDQAGQAWLVGEDPVRAKADFDAAINLARTDPDFLIDRAEALAATKQYWNAIDDLNRASDLAPQQADIYVYRAAAYRAVEAFDLALEDAEHNLRLAPDNPIGLLERGNIRRLRGDISGARQDWMSVAKLVPGSQLASAAESNLSHLGVPDAGPGKPASKP
jgi:tetratricopeptide (TPR) repeat protein